MAKIMILRVNIVRRYNGLPSYPVVNPRVQKIPGLSR